jgi:uncharacterized membrane protein
VTSGASPLAESSRVEAFSDGVFAIALTLLVLDLQAPSDSRGTFLHALLQAWPSYLALLASFLNISAIWVHHHDLFTRVRRVDARLICANLGLLLVASLFPFPAAVISAALRHGDRSDQITASLLYATVGFLVPIAWIVLYRLLARTPQLLTDEHGVAFMSTAQRRATVSLIVYPLAGAVAFLDPVISLVAFAAVPFFFIGTLIYSRGDRA